MYMPTQKLDMYIACIL